MPCSSCVRRLALLHASLVREEGQGCQRVPLRHGQVQSPVTAFSPCQHPRLQHACNWRCRKSYRAPHHALGYLQAWPVT